MGLTRVAPRSRSWTFLEDPVPALASRNASAVLSQYSRRSRRALQALRWLMPQTYDKASNYFEQAVVVTSTFEPLVPEIRLEPPVTTKPTRRGSFDASVHPQLNYTEAICRRLVIGGNVSHAADATGRREYWWKRPSHNQPQS